MKFKAAIIDLDMTLVDSSVAASLRRAGKWTEVYKTVPRFDLYLGIPELLQQLTDNRIRYCIVTSTFEEYSKRVLSHFQIDPEFSICYHHTERHKPHPEPLQLALDRLGLPSSEVFSIGDEANDIKASRSVGVSAFAALWGAKDRSDLSQLADRAFSSPRDLSDYLVGSFRLRVLKSSARDHVLNFSDKGLARCDKLASVFCVGYRFSDDTEDKWTAQVNQFKNDACALSNKCEEVMIRTMRDIGSPEKTIFVVPILGSSDVKTIDTKPVSRMARAIGELDGYQYCSNLLYKTERCQRWHTIHGANNRDAEVEGKYFSHSFRELGLNKPNSVLLVDDIVTRGTTMNDAARAIKKSNGSVVVNGVALAKAERRYKFSPPLDNDRIDDYL